MRVSYYEILEETNSYSERNLLGIESFGSVCRRTLKNVSNVAVKVFNLQVQNAFKSFNVECDVLRYLHHMNLCKVISSCSNLDFNVAAALENLHNGYSIAVIDSDLKPSNVLLDEDMVSHLSDFGIAKFLGTGESNAHTITPVTVGYIAPGEYSIFPSNFLFLKF